ncbi:MAG: hypothetical protein WAO58_10945 [Fimbriimonadaceae bacterium]
MRVYIDEDITPDLADLLTGHVVETTRSRSLYGTKNGELLQILGGEIDVIVTRERNMFYQQNLQKHALGLVVVRSKFNSV